MCSSSIICSSRIIRGFSRISEITKFYAETLPKSPDFVPLQFSKERLVDYGELPHGYIPDALKWARPTSVDKLTNGVKIVTEQWNAPYASISVTVKAGSRQETIDVSSVAQFAAQYALLGTSKYTKERLEELIDSIGGELKVHVTRYLSEFTISFISNAESQAIELLSEIVLHPVYDPVSHESIKSKLYKQASPMDPFTIVYESFHHTAYRDHYMSQPSYGNKDNVYAITPEQVKAYHDKFYVGNNIVVSGAGNIDVKKFKEAVANKFSSVRAEVIGEVPNSEEAVHTYSMVSMRDDEISNTAVMVGFRAPSWNDPDYFAMQLFKRIIGEYSVDKYTGANLNDPALQYNEFHLFLGHRPSIYVHKPYYYAYSDTGLFGNFLYGNEVFGIYLLLASQARLSSYAHEMSQTYVFRGRAKYFNDLLYYNDPRKVSFTNSKQIIYLDRLISRTEAARRVSWMKPEYVRATAHKWFLDKSVMAALYGNLHGVFDVCNYNKVIFRSANGFSVFPKLLGPHW